MRNEQAITEFKLELSARCNNNCRHCYINLPVNDAEALRMEPSKELILGVARAAVKRGALWCTITGGEPLVREDFSDIYMSLKRMGLLISVFTNATLINERYVELFQKYPPTDIEVTVYGVTEKTYEAVTRQPGSYRAFRRGLNLLLDNGIKVRLKAMALRSNFHEMPMIAQFCREYTKDVFRFDPFLYLRLDRDPVRNEEIKSERLLPIEAVSLEMSDPERVQSLEKVYDKMINSKFREPKSNHLFHCGIGEGFIILGHDGHIRLCMFLSQEECTLDPERCTFSEAWQDLVALVKDMRSDNKGFLESCRSCPIISLCKWCPARAYLEKGSMDTWVSYFCQVAHERAKALAYGKIGGTP
jgi:radical SAM protein with 4Fe4S-binding SPASM domain